jgi:eukaryotic-like serine/threonine-protein kinase
MGWRKRTRPASCIGDLKPENVMITAEGLVKILDFGLGKHDALFFDPSRDAATTQLMPPATADGRIVGTVDYMSPEQAAGRPVDSRSDQFSFGSMLCEIVTGKRPFHRDTVV